MPLLTIPQFLCCRLASIPLKPSRDLSVPSKSNAPSRDLPAPVPLCPIFGSSISGLVPVQVRLFIYSRPVTCPPRPNLTLPVGLRQPLSASAPSLGLCKQVSISGLLGVTSLSILAKNSISGLFGKTSLSLTRPSPTLHPLSLSAPSLGPQYPGWFPFKSDCSSTPVP